MSCERGRSASEHLHLGVCGEHGGDPQSIDFFERVGLDYVSCSPYRVPIARLAAARASLQHRSKSAPMTVEPKLKARSLQESSGAVAAVPAVPTIVAAGAS
jgi:pyruvate,orthophosphate dikinase